MITEELKGEKMETYRPIFVDRKTGTHEEASYTVSLFPSEVINWQARLSTAKTGVMAKKEKKI